MPWQATPAPARSGPVTVAGVGPCRATQLDVHVHVADPSYIGAGPVDTSFWAMEVRNTSGVPCFVAPGLEVGLRPAGSTEDVAPRAAGTPTNDILYLAPAGSTPRPPFIAQAQGELGTCPVAPGTTLVVSPGPGLGTLDVDPGPTGGSGRPCADPQSRLYSELFDTGSGPYALPQAQARIAVPGSRPALALPWPWSVHPGEHLRFVVTIVDSQAPHSMVVGPVEPTSPPITFSPCPSYHLELEGVAGTLHTYRLNCAQARTISGGSTESFEMQLDVPADAQSGPAMLLWSLDGATGTVPPARYPVEISAAGGSDG